MPKRRAMSSEDASNKKLSGHQRERDYAKLIGGNIFAGDPRSKPDVIDRHGDGHSVKGGKWWQIFLYGKKRWQTNTRFQGIGNISAIMIECLDAFPDSRDDYLQDKHKYKTLLMEPMKKLLSELEHKGNMKDFLTKAIFDDDEVDYLAIKDKNRSFHLFEKEDVIMTLFNNLILVNSIARNKKQYSFQKVIFKCPNDKGSYINFGEIEIRTDSNIHYREMKCRYNGELALSLFINHIKPKQQKKKGLIAYGQAAQRFIL